MESSNKSNKEYVILKFGEEGEEINYIENGELFITDDEPTEIIGSDNLKTLNKITLTDCVWKDCKLIIPKTVKILHINNGYIGIPDFFEHFPNLEEFGVSEASIVALEQLKNIVTLKKLFLGAMTIEKIDLLSGLINLQELDLGLNKITRIEGLENLKNLSQLNLSNNKIEIIENLSHLTNLKELDLSRNQIQKIEGLEDLKNLKVLDLSENNINKIEGLEHLTKLEDLNLKGYSYSSISLSREEAKSYFKDLVNLKKFNSKSYPYNDKYSFSTYG